MNKLQSLDSICRALGGKCVYLDPSKKWTLEDAKALIKTHWPNGGGGGLTAFKYIDVYMTTSILFGGFNASEDNITEDDTTIQIELTGSYIAYDAYDDEIRNCTDTKTTMSIYLIKTGGAHLA